MRDKTKPAVTKTVPPDTTLSASDARTGMQAAALKQAIRDYLRYSIGRLPLAATPHHIYRALALAVRDRMQHRWMNTSQTYFDLNSKVACYLSAEFLMGPHLGVNQVNLGIEQAARTALAELGLDLDVILACEEEPGLCNGGLLSRCPVGRPSAETAGQPHPFPRSFCAK